MTDPIISAIDHSFDTFQPFSIQVTLIGSMVGGNQQLYKQYRQYLEDKYIDLVRDKPTEVQDTLLGKYHLPLVYINELKRKAATSASNVSEAANALVSMNSNIRAASTLSGMSKGGKRRKLTKRRKTRRRSRR